MLESPASIVVALSALVAVAAAFRLSTRVRNAVVAYFNAEAGPFNLAVLRVIFFAALPFVIPKPAEVENFAGLSESLMVPPAMMTWAPGVFPVSEPAVSIAWIGIVAFSALAAAGIYTRVACAALLLCLAYYLTVPQLFGKVNHYHHILWFTAILTFSRCGDALSFDAVRRAWKGRVVEPISASRAYALPLRIIWLLLGLLYFFPGLYKVWRQGVEWFAPETLRNIMWSRWYSLDGWEPIVRVDQVPLFLTIGAIATIVFELGFIVAIFLPRVRPWLPFAALGFHNTTNLMMRISFVSLQVVHLSLIDWERVSRYVFRQPLVFAYDGGCGMCRRAAASLRAITLPGGVRYAVAQDLDRPDTDRLVAEIHVLDGDRAYTGFRAYRRVVRRIPPLWPILPLLYLPLAESVGQRLYERVSLSRTCATALPHPGSTVRPVLRVTAVAAAGGVLALGVLLAGLRGAVASWPLATYPTFAEETSSTAEDLVYRAHMADGSIRRGSLARAAGLAPERATGLIGKILRSDGPRQRRMIASLTDALPSRYRRIQVFRVVVSLDPDQQGRVLRATRISTRS